jgi:single-stranded DNA-binding protein
VQRQRRDSNSGAWVQYAASFGVVVWGHLASRVATCLCRAREVAVDGWLDVHHPRDGAKVVRVVADGVQLLGSITPAARAR